MKWQSKCKCSRIRNEKNAKTCSRKFRNQKMHKLQKTRNGAAWWTKHPSFMQGSRKGPHPQGVWCRQLTLMQESVVHPTAQTHDYRSHGDSFTIAPRLPFLENDVVGSLIWSKLTLVPFHSLYPMKMLTRIGIRLILVLCGKCMEPTEKF